MKHVLSARMSERETESVGASAVVANRLSILYGLDNVAPIISKLVEVRFGARIYQIG